MRGRRLVLTLTQRIEAGADRGHDLTFVVGGDPVAVPYRQLHEEARAYAADLQALGVAPGDHVALLGPTTRPLVTAIQAIWLAGATRRGAAAADAARLDRGVRRTRPACASPTPTCRSCSSTPSWRRSSSPQPGDPPMVGCDAVQPGPGRAGADAWERPADDPDALAILQFTSGSTSDPKGVMLPHRTVGANLDAIADGHVARPRRRRARVVAAAVPRHGPGRAASRCR